MRPELEKRLEAEFPGFFDGLGGFECRDGWFDLVRGLTARIKAILPDGAPFRVSCVKEKFAALRYYWDCEGIDDATRDEVDWLIEEAESASCRTCEDCGRPGVPRSGGWFNTLCDEHAKGRKPASFERAPGMSKIDGVIEEHRLFGLPKWPRRQAP